jgi:hypothetical protein
MHHASTKVWTEAAAHNRIGATGESNEPSLQHVRSSAPQGPAGGAKKMTVGRSARTGVMKSCRPGCTLDSVTDLLIC